MIFIENALTNLLNYNECGIKNTKATNEYGRNNKKIMFLVKYKLFRNTLK